ncbi:Pogo transposable element-like 6 [Homarus americanus]|uniref:Pogo transposable element-like 6 n=1 Tax=Homarus americanus TaxID=6706 RepID=A0A8J5NBK0_HOMAM|nr:Pogo transposable element-like 6 [Homarus americanus]
MGPKNLPDEEKAHILAWKLDNVPSSEICKRTGRGKSTIKHLLTTACGLPPNVIPPYKTSGRPRKTTKGTDNLLQREVLKDPGITAARLKKSHPCLHAEASQRTIQHRLQKELKLPSQCAARKPLLTDHMHKQRLDPIVAPNAKRRRYEASFKLKVVAYAKSHNNCAAARECGVTEKMVREWRSKEHLLRSIPMNKCAMRRGTAHWPNLEKHTVDMVHEQRQNGYSVSRNKIRIWALKWAKANKEHSKDFKGTASWCSRFMERYDLVLRKKTKISQKLPADLDCKITNFHRHVIQQRKEHGYPLSNIGNMDETPLNFNMVGNHTVDTTEHEQTQFTVALSCMADGTKLNPMIIFKRKTMPKIKFPAGVFVHVNEKGWMDEQGIKLWIDHIWCGNMLAPELDVLCEFVIKAWSDINVETVIKSFKKCGISNSMDGMEDDMLWEDEDETEAEATSSDLEFDPYDEAAINVSQDVLEELMMSDVDDVDFEGF